MSKRTKSKTKNTSRPSALTQDAFTNMLARLGAGTPNLLESTDYPMTRLTKDWQMMDSLYRSHWVARRVVDVVPGDMVKNWYKLTCQVDPDALARFVRMERRVKIKAKLLQGLRWGRLYGGAGALMIIGGHEGVLDQPLDYDTIVPGSFRGLLVLDRWTGLEPGRQLVEDPADTEFGLPNEYTITGVGIERPVRVHHSRILRFEGRDLPEIERQMENYWGASEIEHVFDELKKRDNTSWNMALLVFHANLRILKLDQMEQVLGVAPKEVQNELYAALLAQNHIMSNMGMMVTGKEEDVTSLQYTFSGLADVYEQFMMDLAGAAEIPVTKLFGRSPAGLNATGESDMQNYYDSIEEKQEAYLAPVLDKLLPVMACSEWGGVPDDLDWEFNPVRRPSEDERKSLSEQISTAVFDAYNAGLITQRMALKELRQSTELTGMWSNITDEDLARANDEFESPLDEMMGGFGGGGFGEQAPEPPEASPLDRLTRDEEVWRSTETGRHFKIETTTGEIKAGFGGKLNGLKPKEDPGKTGSNKNEPQENRGVVEQRKKDVQRKEWGKKLVEASKRQQRAFQEYERIQEEYITNLSTAARGTKGKIKAEYEPKIKAAEESWRAALQETLPLQEKLYNSVVTGWGKEILSAPGGKEFISNEIKKYMTEDEGGPGSGNFNHAGRPGEVGGSAPAGSAGGKSEFDPEAEREKIKNGTYPSKVVKGKQRKHTPGTREFEQNAAKMERESPGSKPAILKANAQNLVKKYKGTGEIRKPRGADMPKERVMHTEVIGQTWVQSLKKYVDTKAFEIVYSSKGAHIVPINDRNQKKD